MGSEMCIRDRYTAAGDLDLAIDCYLTGNQPAAAAAALADHLPTCLLYTSDAADERSSVDLGGRRIIKKKKQRNTEQ